MNQEQVWIEAARQGDQSALGCLVEAYQGTVYNLTYRMLGDPDEAEDAAQETFLRVYRKLDSYDPSRKFKTWLLSIASHHCIDRLRRRRLFWLSLEDDSLPASVLVCHEPGPESCALCSEQEAQVQALLDTLTSDYRVVVLLHYWEGLSCAEIAQTLGSTAGAVKSRLFRARRILAQQLRGSEVEMAYKRWQKPVGQSGNVRLPQSLAVGTAAA